tara:strand:+ start:77 stop:544 length:468 start_codon:yes stop_codon:yes gene_type:complete
MLLLLNSNNININNISILDKTVNNIIIDGFFHRIIYNSQSFCSNGLFISFNLYNFTIEKYYNKLKCVFNKRENVSVINFLKNIEKNLLENKYFKNHNKLYRIKEQLDQNFIKIYPNNSKINFDDINNIKLILKISGVWSENNSCGLTFRFFLTHN